jgi:hypothetical protein
MGLRQQFGSQTILGYVLAGSMGALLLCGYWWFTGKVFTSKTAVSPTLATLGSTTPSPAPAEHPEATVPNVARTSSPATIVHSRNDTAIDHNPRSMRQGQIRLFLESHPVSLPPTTPPGEAVFFYVPQHPSVGRGGASLEEHAGDLRPYAHAGADVIKISNYSGVAVVDVRLPLKLLYKANVIGADSELAQTILKYNDTERESVITIPKIDPNGAFTFYACNPWVGRYIVFVTPPDVVTLQVIGSNVQRKVHLSRSSIGSAPVLYPRESFGN